MRETRDLLNPTSLTTGEVLLVHQDVAMPQHCLNPRQHFNLVHGVVLLSRVQLRRKERRHLSIFPVRTLAHNARDSRAAAVRHQPNRRRVWAVLHRLAVVVPTVRNEPLHVFECALVRDSHRNAYTRQIISEVAHRAQESAQQVASRSRFNDDIIQFIKLWCVDGGAVARNLARWSERKRLVLVDKWNDGLRVLQYFVPRSLQRSLTKETGSQDHVGNEELTFLVNVLVLELRTHRRIDLGSRPLDGQLHVDMKSASEPESSSASTGSPFTRTTITSGFTTTRSVARALDAVRDTPFTLPGGNCAPAQYTHCRKSRQSCTRRRHRWWLRQAFRRNRRSNQPTPWAQSHSGTPPSLKLLAQRLRSSFRFSCFFKIQPAKSNLGLSSRLSGKDCSYQPPPVADRVKVFVGLHDAESMPKALVTISGVRLKCRQDICERGLQQPPHPSCPWLTARPLDAVRLLLFDMQQHLQERSAVVFDVRIRILRRVVLKDIPSSGTSSKGSGTVSRSGMLSAVASGVGLEELVWRLGLGRIQRVDDAGRVPGPEVKVGICQVRLGECELHSQFRIDNVCVVLDAVEAYLLKDHPHADTRRVFHRLVPSIFRLENRVCIEADRVGTCPCVKLRWTELGCEEGLRIDKHIVAIDAVIRNRDLAIRGSLNEETAFAEALSIIRDDLVTQIRLSVFKDTCRNACMEVTEGSRGFQRISPPSSASKATPSRAIDPTWNDWDSVVLSRNALRDVDACEIRTALEEIPGGFPRFFDVAERFSGQLREMWPGCSQLKQRPFASSSFRFASDKCGASDLGFTVVSTAAARTTLF
uniref:Uncharacterized protein n=1 Tax=Mycena chlorophos TaxID=658473 RepID=A0ABQ0LGA1_MYCCL|nr:predicted protein [Mycena chlorophos]